MKEKELEQLFEKEEYDVKYMSELRQYWNAYMYALINEIYVGVGINLGLSEKEAYKLAKEVPGNLEKAGFFKSIFNKFKTIFKHTVPKFRYPKKIISKNGSQMTEKQWKKFNDYIENFWFEHANKVAEDIAVKSSLLGKQTTEYREKKKPYKNKSLYQVEFDQYDGEMPSNIKEAYANYDFNNSEKKIVNKALSSIGMYVTRTSSDIQDAIRQNVQIGLENGKSSTQIASDMYWNIQKNENFVNKYTAESLRKNWNRIATTEMAYLYEAMILAPYESEAMESLKDSSKAVYMVRSGGTCSWCRPRQGTLVRLVPTSVVVDFKSESLKGMGIKDPNTDIAIWVGKNNIGLKLKDYLICCPAHPYNTATFVPIDLKTEYYNPKTGNVEKRQEKKKFIPQMEDYDAKVRKEKEDRKPTFVDSNLVQFNNNLYIAVDSSEYNKKLEEYRKDPSGPIPVNRNSPQYKQIFEEANKQ